MSKVVDEKVVEMRFDNKNFEKNVQGTISTLDRLKEKLNLTGASKGLENLNIAANKVDMSNMGNALETIKTKFSALQIIGVTALANITNSAINAGKQLLNSLSVANISLGWDKLQQKATSMSTLISQGYSTETVEKQLEKLNWFSDETSYNFTDMIDNISKFTATGKDLNESVQAMEGIALWAAKSGQNAQKASMAMYQLSQALGAGYMRREDWKSIQNYSMDTAEFRQAAIDTAIELKTLKKVADDTYASLTGNKKSFTKAQFAESLTEGQWFTADVMMKVYNKYAKGAEQVKNIIDTMSEKYNLNFIAGDILRLYDGLNGLNKQGKTFDDFIDPEVTEEAREELRKMVSELDKFGMGALKAGQEYRTFKDVMDATRDAVSTKWMGIFETILGNIDEQKQIWTTMGEKFYEWFAEPLNDFQAKLSKWSILGGRSDMFEGLKNIGEMIKSIIGPISEAFKEIFPEKTAQDLADLTKRFKEFTETLKISDETAANIKETFKGIFSVISFAINVIKSLAKGAFNITKALFGFSGGLLEVTSNISTFVSSITEGAKKANIFKNIIEGISKFITDIIYAVKNFAGKFLNGAVRIIKTVGSVISNIVTTVFSSISEAIQSGDANKFMDLLNKGLLATLILKVRKFINFLARGGTFVDTIQKFLGSIQHIAMDISDILNSVRTSLEVWQTNLKVKTLMKIAIAIGVLAASVIALSGVDNDKLKTSLSAITTLFLDLVVALKVLSAGSITGGASKMSLAIGLAFSMFILAKALQNVAEIPTKGIIKGIAAIFAMIKIMVMAVNGIATESKKAVKGALGIIAFSAAIYILSKACQELGAMDIKSLIKGGIAVAGLIAALGLFIRFAKTENATMVKAGIGMIGMAAAMLILSNACKEFGSMSPNQLTKSMLAIGSILVAFGTFFGFSKFYKKTLSSAIAVNLMVLALWGLAKVFKEYENISDDAISRGAAAMISTLLTITSALTVLGSMYGGGFSGGIKLLFASMSIQGLVGSLKMIAEAFAEFAKLSIFDIARGLVAVGSSLAILIFAMKKLDAKDPIALTITSLALMILAKSVAILGAVGFVGVATGILAFAGVFTVLGVATKLLKPLIPTMFKLSLAIVSFAGSFALLGASIFALGTGLIAFITGLVTAFLGFKILDWDTIGKGLFAIAGAFIIIGVSAKVLKPLIGTLFGLAGAIALFGLSCASIGVGIALITSSLSTLASIGEEGAKTAGESLKILFTSMLELIPITIKQLGLGIIEFLKVIKDMMPVIFETVKATILMLVDVIVECAPDIVRGFLELITTTLKDLVQYLPMIANLLFDLLIQLLNTLTTRLPELVTAVVNFLAKLFEEVIKVFNNLDTDNLLKGLVAIGLLTAITFALSAVLGAIPGALAAVLGLGVMVAELALVISAIGALAQIPGLKWLVEQGGNLLQAVGTAIGKFIGGIVGGFAAGATSTLPDVGTNLSQFMINLTPFLIGVKLIDASTLGNVFTLIGIIMSITAANILEGITSWITGGSSITKFANQLPILGDGLASFSSIVSTVNTEKVKNAAEALKTIAEMASFIPNEGGIISWFAGDNSMAKWAFQLPILGEAIRMFAYSIEGMDSKAVMLASIAAKHLAEMTNYIPNQDGLKVWLLGGENVSIWGEQLPSLGNGLKLFADSVAGIDAKSVILSAIAAQAIAEMTNTIPNEGGIASWFAGDNSVAKWASQLPILGTGLKSFAMSVNGLDTDSIYKAVDVSKAIAEMANIIPNEGGIKAWFAGDNSMAKWASNLPNLGKGLKDFANSLEGINVTSLYIASAACKNLTEITNSTPTSSTKLEMFGTNLVKLSSKLKEFMNNMVNIDLEQLYYAIRKVLYLIDLTKAIASVEIDSLTDFGDSLRDVAKGIIDGFIGVFNDDDPKKKAKEAIINMMAGISEGADEKKSSIIEQFRNMVGEAIASISDRSLMTQAETHGKNLVLGFANGIRRNKSIAVDIATKVGEDSVKALKTAIDSNSPSKETFKLGNFFGIGFINGIKDLTSKAYNESYDIGSNAKRGLNKAISNISNIINSDMDTQPVITPVLDLSNVQSGVGALNSMFGNPSLDVLSNLNAISYGINTNHQNGGENVVEAINKLRNDMNNTNGDTYNINGITYDDGSNVKDAVQTLVRVAKIERRV